MPDRAATNDATWLLTHGQRALDLATFVDGFCDHLRTTGLSIARASINVRILHPLLVGRGFIWQPDRPLTELAHDRETLGHRVLVSDDVGRHALRGLDDSIDLFTLAGG